MERSGKECDRAGEGWGGAQALASWLGWGSWDAHSPGENGLGLAPREGRWASGERYGEGGSGRGRGLGGAGSERIQPGGRRYSENQ